jgi:hypothetical protein
MRYPALLALTALSLTGCGALLMTDGEAEIRHRRHAITSDGGSDIIVGEESYLWDCGGTMARCYDRESDFGYAIYRIDPADASKRDTLARFPGSRAFPGGYAEPILYHSTARDRMLERHTDTTGASRLMLTDARGRNGIDLLALPGVSGRYVADALPSPDFGRAALLTQSARFNPMILIVDLGAVEPVDSVEVPLADFDTTAAFGRGLLWESDTSLVMYGKGHFTDKGEVAYRIRGGAVTDTIARWGCLDPRRTSSGPFKADGSRLRMSDSGLVIDPPEPWRCKR